MKTEECGLQTSPRRARCPSSGRFERVVWSGWASNDRPRENVRRVREVTDRSETGMGASDIFPGQGDFEDALRALLEGPMDDGRRFGAVTRSPPKQGRVTTASGEAGQTPDALPREMRGKRSSFASAGSSWAAPVERHWNVRDRAVMEKASSRRSGRKRHRVKTDRGGPCKRRVFFGACRDSTSSRETIEADGRRIAPSPVHATSANWS